MRKLNIVINRIIILTHSAVDSRADESIY